MPSACIGSRANALDYQKERFRSLAVEAAVGSDKSKARAMAYISDQGGLPTNVMLPGGVLYNVLSANTTFPAKSDGKVSGSTLTSAANQEIRKIEAFVDMLTEQRRQGYLSFHGYRCDCYCYGHEEGYAWAEEQTVSRVSDCEGRNRSFREGCIAYVSEQEGDVFGLR